MTNTNRPQFIIVNYAALLADVMGVSLASCLPTAQRKAEEVGGLDHMIKKLAQRK